MLEPGRRQSVLEEAASCSTDHSKEGGHALVPLSLPSNRSQWHREAVMWPLEISLPGMERGGEWQTENGHHSLLHAIGYLGRQG